VRGSQAFKPIVSHFINISRQIGLIRADYCYHVLFRKVNKKVKFMALLKIHMIESMAN
jgi:hypothetical protein